MAFLLLLMDGCTKNVPSPSINMSHISYIDETWHSYTLTKEDPEKT